MKWSAFGVLLVSVLALPVRADRLVQQTAAEFEGGTLENVSVVSSGRIIPAAAPEVSGKAGIFRLGHGRR